VARPERTRERIVASAADLYAEHGYAGVTVRDVASGAGVTARTVRRHFPRDDVLFAEVVAERARSEVAERLARQAQDDVEPANAVLLWAAREIFAAPEQNWGILELEALLAARRDPEAAELMRVRLAERWESMAAVARQSRRIGAVDEVVNDDALVHFSLALSLGMSLVAPVIPARATEASWTAFMARLLTSLAPQDFTLHGVDRGVERWRVRLDMEDHVGSLAQVARALTTVGAYIGGFAALGSEHGWRTVDFVITVPSNITADDIKAAAESVGRRAYVARGSVDDALDLPTRVLDGATELVTNPGSAPAAAAALVEADRYEVTDAVAGEDDSADVLRLQWTPERHVVLHRHWAPFARAEKTRASALLRLAAAMAATHGDIDAYGWVEPLRGGGTVWLRLARPEDAEAVSAMHERCSEQTRYQRYFAPVSEWRDVNLRRLSGGHRGVTLVVMNEDGLIIGLGNVFPNAPDDLAAAEIALLVEDDYQSCGVGTRLLHHMLSMAGRLGFAEVVATVLADNKAMLRVLDNTGLRWTKRAESGVVNLRAPLQLA
jgi:AcrR family transcriptional regulator/RimJ/RimL family protein N-acetyltransferase